MIEWSKPDFTEEEFSAAMASLEVYVGANGPEVKKLEQEFASRVGSKHAIAVCNGTAALLVSLMCIKKTHGQTKIGVPSFTFIASANSCAHIYGKENTVLLDCNRKTWNLDRVPSDIGALMAVDVGGLSCDYNYLRKLNIPIIADSAESLGSTCHGELVGSQADFHCFSLHRSKIVSCGEGGMITTNSDEYNDLARSFLNHGYSKDKKPYEYKHDNYGLNYRMSDVNAAIARVQLRKLDKYVKHRNFIADIYKQELNGLVEFQQFDSFNFLNNYFFFGVLCENRDTVLQHLLNNEIKVKTWSAVHQQPIWSDINLTNSEMISNKIILLPIHNTISEAEVTQVIKTIKQVI